jgi:hypothetical protein
VIDALTRMTCAGWFPVRRGGRSHLRGRLAVELVSGLVLSELSVCSNGRRRWVSPPARWKLDPYTGKPAADEAVAALLREFPAALDEEEDGDP